MLHTIQGVEQFLRLNRLCEIAVHALLEALEKAHEENLYMQVLKTGAASEETSRTRAETISGLAEHDIYHLGQIAMLKKALRMKK